MLGEPSRELRLSTEMPVLAHRFALATIRSPSETKRIPVSGDLHEVATENAEAQKYFDLGLQLVFGFNRAEAVRCFRNASQLYPQAAMPYWGMALACGRHMNMDHDMELDCAQFCATQIVCTECNRVTTSGGMVRTCLVPRLSGRCVAKSMSAR